ncbi:MAG: FAD synthetase family protein, partial [Bdellovibrio sp.]
MHIFQGVEQMTSSLECSIVTIGNFDGVHLGHQQLLENVVREARHYAVPAVVYTFHPHPVKVLHPERATYRLFDLRDQQEQFAGRGIDVVITQPFTPEFSQVSAQDFLEHYIMRPLNPKTLVVGHD